MPGKANSTTIMTARAIRFLPPLETRLIKILSLLFKFCFIRVFYCLIAYAFHGVIGFEHNGLR